MKKLLAFLLGLFPALVGAGTGPHSCVWGSACDVPVDIYAPDGVDFALTADIAVAAGDIEWYCPGQAVSSGTLTVTEIAPRGFYVTVPSALTDCARFEVKVRDQDATPAYLATSAHVATCGNASAAHVNCTSGLSTHAATDIVTGGAINTTGGAIDNVTTVTTNTDMRGTDNAAPASTALTNATWTDARAAYLDAATSSRAPSSTALSSLTWTSTRALYLDALNGHIAQSGDTFPIIDDLTEDVAGLRYTQKALEEAPSGTGGGPVDLNPDQSTVTIGTCNTVTNPVTAGTVNDKDNYNLAPSQPGVTIGTCSTVGNMAVSALQTFFNQNSGLTYADAVPGSVVYETAENAQTAALTEEELALALGGFIGIITTVTNPTTFQLDQGPAAADSLNDEYTASIRDATNGNIPTCHRQVQSWVPPSTLVIDSQCPAAFTVAVGDSVVVVPNGAGAPIPTVNVSNGAVETDLTVQVDGALSLGCMLSAINAVETGAQTVVGGTDYTYRNPGDTENRVVATRTASGRTQATITCPAGL